MQVKQRLDALTSLRFVAAMMIVIGHAYPIFGSRVATLMPLNQGVSFFFVLSGFILAWNYPALTDSHARRSFLLARFARIWPLHVVTCFLWIALIFNFDRATHFPGASGFLRLTANLMLLQVWVPMPKWGLSFNGVSWSISAELFFYAMFPLLIFYWRQHWHRLLAVQAFVVVLFVGIATSYSLPAADTYPGVGLLGLIYFNPLVRILEFSVGIALSYTVRCIIASGFQLPRAQWLLLEIAVLVAVFIGLLAAANFSGIAQALGEPAAYYFSHEGLWLLWALLIGVFALRHGPVAQLMSLRIAVFLGEISFAMYLCHAILIHYLENYTVQIQAFGAWGYMAFWVWVLGFAALLFIGVETPFRKFVLQAVRQREVLSVLREHFRAKEVAALLLLACMAGAMYFLRPSTIVKLDEREVSILLQPSSELLANSPGAIFDGRYEIVGLRVQDKGANVVQVQVLLRALQTMRANDVLALHLNDHDGKFLGNFDARLDFGRTAIPAGTSWIKAFEVPRALFERTASLGLAMYANPSNLFEANGGERDWDGRRLVFPLAH